MADVQHNTLTGADLHVCKLHASTHKTGGTDHIHLDELEAASNNTDLDVSITAHGLCPLLPNDAAQFLDGVGAWGIPGPAPPGGVVMWMTETIPAGWLECNGASVLRASYTGLFSVIGTKYGVVDGTHFTLPDMRGYFPRGWDHARGIDPNAATRTDRGDGTVGDHVGTKQVDAFKSHVHSGGAHYSIYPYGGAEYPVTEPADTGATGGSETRPVNLNVMFIIKT